MGSTRANGEQIIQEYNYLDAEKDSIKSHLQDITDYIVPTKTDVSTREQTANTRTSARRYDSTAVHSNILLSSSIHGNLTSDAQQWFMMTLGDHVLNEHKEVKDWLEDCSRKLFFSLNGTPFSNELQEGYECLTGYGTTGIFMGETRGERGIVRHTFETIPLRQFVFSEGEDGIADTLMREYPLTARQINDRYSSHPFFRGLTDEMEKALKSSQAKDQNKKFPIIVCVKPRMRYNPDAKVSLDFKIMHAVVDKKTKKVILESGFHESPIVVPRWRKTADDKGWGTGIGAVALPDTLSLNEAKRLGFKAWAKDLNPPLVATHKGVIGSIRTGAGGVIYKKRGAELGPLQSGARWDTSQFNFEELRDQIRSIFYTDQLQLHQSPAMTAAEAQIRYELMMKILGPTYGRLKTEMYNPMLYRAFNISLRAGHFLPPPQVLLQSLNTPNPPKLDVEYRSPMARAQRSDDIGAIERVYGMAGHIFSQKGDPSIWDNLNDDEALKLSAEIAGLPSKVMNGEKEIKSQRDARAQAASEVSDEERMSAELDAGEKVVNIQNKMNQG
jgi:hypothetical protein